MDQLSLGGDITDHLTTTIQQHCPKMYRPCHTVVSLPSTKKARFVTVKEIVFVFKVFKLLHELVSCPYLNHCFRYDLRPNHKISAPLYRLLWHCRQSALMTLTSTHPPCRIKHVSPPTNTILPLQLDHLQFHPPFSHS